MKAFMQEIPKHKCGKYLRYVEDCIKKMDNKSSIYIGMIYYCGKCRVYYVRGKEFKSKKQLTESVNNDSVLEEIINETICT